MQFEKEGKRLEKGTICGEKQVRWLGGAEDDFFSRACFLAAKLNELGLLLDQDFAPQKLICTKNFLVCLSRKEVHKLLCGDLSNFALHKFFGDALHCNVLTSCFITAEFCKELNKTISQALFL